MRKRILLLFLFFFVAGSLRAELKTQTVTYEFDGTQMKGHLAWDDSIKGKRPGILVVHEFWGLNDYARGRAEQLAKMGYVALAADMYGEGKSSVHPEEARAMMESVRGNLKTWMGRANAALQVLRNNEFVDAKRLGAIGYCFGGATVLELAYTGATDVLAVVSFHGALPLPESTQAIKAKILILQGAEDPFVTPENIQKLKALLDQGKVSYQFIAYPGAGHSYTVSNSEKMGMKGVAYNAEADRLSWQEMTKLFDQVFKMKK